MTDTKPNRLYFYVLPYLVLVTIHIMMGLKMQYPIVFSDEAAYLGRARYLSGASHMIQGSGFYHFGYSLFLLPAFWLFSDPSSVYSAVMVINAFIMSSLYFGLFYIMYILFEYPKRITLLISFSCCLYPAFVLQSNIACSENAFIPFYVFYLALVGALLKEKSWWAVFCLGFVSSFLYTIHPRGLLILPITFIFLCTSAIKKMLPKLKVFLSITMMFFVFVITRYGNDFMSSLDCGRTVDNYIKEKVFDVLLPSNWIPSLLAAAGQFLYLIEATYGLFFIGIVYICILIWEKWSNDRLNAFADIRFCILVMLLVSSAAIFFSSSVSILPIDTRGDRLVYGRYNEGFLALYVAFALVSIYEGHSLPLTRVFNPFITAIIILLLSFIISLGYDYSTLLNCCKISNVNVLNIFGFCPFIAIFQRIDFIIIALITILLMSILIYVFKINFSLGLCLLTVYFMTVTACGYTILFIRSDYIRNITMLKHNIASLGDVKVLSYDRRYYDPQTWFNYQYFLPHVVFDTFDSRKKQLPRSQVVVSGNKWNGGGKLKAELLASENPTAQVPPILQKIAQIFSKNPLEHKGRVDQALWLVKETKSKK